MPAIPEFVLRKLYVTDSLVKGQDNFSFELNNTFVPVSITALEILSDQKPIALQNISLTLPEQPALNSSQVSAGQPFLLAVNVNLLVSVKAAPPENSLTIKAETREAGLLQFSIVLKQGRNPLHLKTDVFKRVKQKIQQNLQMIKVSRDPQHPLSHFCPPANWMNDPCGLIQWEGLYHLFYQFNPDEAAWGNIHWGHAISPDLVHWKHSAPALAPDPDGLDAGGVFTGCAAVINGQPVLLYTGVFPEVQCLAQKPDKNLNKWEKLPNPVIARPPEGLQLEGFRDPYVWQEGNEWKMIIGSGLSGKGGVILLYTSKDLLTWEYLGVLYEGNANDPSNLDSGTMWECPNFFPLGNKWVLILSACSSEGGLYTLYTLGDYKENKFLADAPLRLLDHGAANSFYAPQVFTDNQGRKILFAWLREERDKKTQMQAGWSGVMSFPRTLELGEKGELLCKPAPEINSLRKNKRDLLPNTQQTALIRGSSLEIKITFDPKSRQDQSIRLRSSLIPEEYLLLGYNPEQARITLDCRPAGGALHSFPPFSSAKEKIDLHIFIDGTLVEVFLDDRLCLSARYTLSQPARLDEIVTGDVKGQLWDLENFYIR